MDEKKCHIYGFFSSHVRMWELDHKEGWAFELWCWRRLLRVPRTARRSNQSILNEVNPGISLEGMMLKLKLQYFGHLMWRVDSLEKTLMLGGTGGRRRRGRQRMRWLDGITDYGLESGWTPGVGDGQLACCDSWGRKETDMTEWLNWTELGTSKFKSQKSRPAHRNLCPSPNPKIKVYHVFLLWPSKHFETSWRGCRSLPTSLIKGLWTFSYHFGVHSVTSLNIQDKFGVKIPVASL